MWPLAPTWPLLLLPVHVVFLELIIDPSCTLVFEAEEAEQDVMQRPPRRHDAPLFGRRNLLLSLLQGLCVLGVSVGVFLYGRDVLEAVRTSVNPKVIDCPGRNAGKDSLDGVAQNGIQLKVRARVTVRANLQQLIGGATEETIIARVGEGIVSAIGSAKSHLEVLESPDRISKTVLARRVAKRWSGPDLHPDAGGRQA